MSIRIKPHLELRALPELPLVQPGADVADIIWQGLARARLVLLDGDVLVVSSKLVSRANGRFVDISGIEPSPEAEELARTVDKDARLVELILRDSVAVSRATPGALIVRHRLGFVVANAAIDQSNAQPAHTEPGSGPWALLLPEDPDADAARLRDVLEQRAQVTIGVILSDSFGRPFREGTVGTAVGVAGVPAINDQRGRPDLHGRELEHTVTALADQIAAAADLVAGQADEGRGVVHVRGLVWDEHSEREWARQSARDLIRPLDKDLYA